MKSGLTERRNINTISKVMFCGVCGFRVSVRGLAELPEVSGTGAEVFQNQQKFRVLWHRHI